MKYESQNRADNGKAVIAYFIVQYESSTALYRGMWGLENYVPFERCGEELYMMSNLLKIEAIRSIFGALTWISP